MQVLSQSPLGDKFRRRGLLLLSKICRAQGIIPVSYTLRRELIRDGKIRYHGGFAEVSDGEYAGLPVAIKHLKMHEGDFERMFKVPLISLPRYHWSAFNVQLLPSDYVERSSAGNTCPIRTSYRCWGFLCLQTRLVSAF